MHASMFRPRGLQQRLPLLVAGVALGLLIVTAYLSLLRAALPSAGNAARRAMSNGQADTLVVYIFSASDGEYLHNLHFFARYGIAEDDGCDYIIVIQTEDGAAVPPAGVALPAVPTNVRYEFHPNGCYDWGTIGWVLSNGKVDWRLYKYFIFMNSSVRGPFLPPAVRGLVRWQDLLISKLRGKVKLVGPTISCEGSPKDGNAAGEWRTNPHVQSYVLATDQVGLRAWLEDGRVFKCYSSMWDTIYYSELGSSLVLLERGYTFDSLMTRYQGVDWHDQANWDCNARVNPYGQHYYDGITLSPYEVMFVKVKDLMLLNRWQYAEVAAKYHVWYDQQGKPEQDVVSNQWKADPWPLKMQQVLYMQRRGSDCFDFERYKAANPDLVRAGMTTPEQLWEHWYKHGQFEGRGHRFTCVPPSEL